jgi:hypothetical protein
MQHSAEGPGRICTAAEAEDIDVVLRAKIPHQKLIRVRNIIRDAVTEREADHSRPPFAYSGESIACSHGADARVVVGDLSLVADDHLVELYDIRVRGAELVASTVAADHDVSLHFEFSSG